jgi:DNA-binding beta-propeller fold protein YncE
MRAPRLLLLFAFAAASFSLAAGASSLGAGGTLWAARYNGPPSKDDDAHSVALSSDATRVFVTGESYGGSSGDDAVTVAYSASSGSKLWSTRFKGLGSGTDRGNAVAASPDGIKVFVAGVTDADSRDYLTVAYNATTGSKLWSAQYDGAEAQTDNAWGLAVSPDGTKVFVTGISTETATTRSYTTVAYNASTGAKLWAAHYGVPGSFAPALAVSATKVFVTGGTYAGTSTGYDYGTIAYNASTGAKAWSTRYTGLGGPGSETASGIGVSSDGTKVVVTGQSSGSGGPEFATVAYNASNGAKLWASRNPGAKGPGDSADPVADVAVAPDGQRVVVAGPSVGTNTTGPDYVTIAYGSAGGKLWSTRYDGFGHSFDTPFALALNGDGSQAYVTGMSNNGTPSAINYDYATVAYGTGSGSKLWASKYDGPYHNDDSAAAIAAGGGRIVVTGSSYKDTTTKRDYATAAYQG